MSILTNVGGFFGKGAQINPYQAQYKSNRYAIGAGNRADIADKAAFKLLMQEMGRKPGLSAEEMYQIRGKPLRESRMSQARGLREMNRNVLGSGRYGVTGARTKGAGMLESAGQRTRADINQSAAATAAQFARMDRQNQIAQGSQYAMPRYGMYGNEMARMTGFEQWKSGFDLKKILEQLAQENYETEWTWSNIVGPAMQAGGGMM